LVRLALLALLDLKVQLALKVIAELLVTLDCKVILERQEQQVRKVPLVHKGLLACKDRKVM
jgi:hypothetical protein